MLIIVLLILGIVVGIFSVSVYKRKCEDNTLTITVCRNSALRITEALEKEFPDINFVVNQYSGCNNSLYLKELLKRGKAGDIFLYTTFYNDTDAPTYLVDLSGYPFLTNYDKGILSILDVDGAIYQIPGPITVRYVLVNKTLFEKNGWKIPENFEEMVTVCKQIREDMPEIAPLGLGMLGQGFAWSLVTSYAQMGFLDTAEGQAAEKGYLQGRESFEKAFGEGLDMVGKLIDAGAFMPDRFMDTWDVTPKQMGNREAAMCYVMGANASYTPLISGQAKGNPEYGKYSADDFVVLPMYGKSEKNRGLILGTTNTWGISKYLEEKGNEKKLKNALRVLEYISSEEGQNAISQDPAAIPALKNLKSEDIPEFMRNLWNDNTNSIKSFFLYTGYEHMLSETAQILIDAMAESSSEGMKDEFIALADQLNEEYLQSQMSSAAFGYIEDDMSVKQTRKISCEAFRAAAEADMAIASESGIKNDIINPYGLSGNLFKGSVTSESLTLIVAAQNVNVEYVYLTGKEISNMQKQGKHIKNEDGEEASFDYWISGDNIDSMATYKVAMLEGDYSQEFADNHEIIDTGVGILEALENYFRNIGEIK